MLTTQVFQAALAFCNEMPKPRVEVTLMDGTKTEGVISSVKGLLPVVVVWLKKDVGDEAVLIENVRDIAKL